MLYRSIGTLSQVCGLPPRLMRRGILKEVTDNALDAAGGCRVEWRETTGTYIVEDDGPGLHGDAAEIAALFSIRRNLASSKLWRRPSRGAMGNGIRVLVGAVAASGGTLVVSTRGKSYHLEPQDDGTTRVVDVSESAVTGTRIEYTLGESVPEDRSADGWARTAMALAPHGEYFKGKPSPWWHTGDSWFELCRASGGMTVRDLVSRLDGCTGAKAGEIAASFRGKAAKELTRSEAADLLRQARDLAKPVKASRLGEVGVGIGLPDAYARTVGTAECADGRGVASAQIPFVVEAWALASGRGEDSIEICVNRTPIAATVEVDRPRGERARIALFGCGLAHSFEVGTRSLRLLVNVTTPWMPITTSGKEPDLVPFIEQISLALTRASRKASRGVAKGTSKATMKARVLECLPAAIAHTGGEDRRYSQRQLFYTVRDLVKRGGVADELKWGWFCRILKDRVAATGQRIPRMYKDTRGVLYHPHLHTEIQLGTLAIEQYEPPAWTFNKILYIEKEGLFEVLKAERWPERHDCALMSAKGYANDAAEDVIDAMAATSSGILFFCLHDADAYGTMIHQDLQRAADSRPGKAKVINLGLDPWEAVEMGLQVEPVEKTKRRKPVAEYVATQQRFRRDRDWVEWLQSHRVELNSMTSPQLIAFLDAKMELESQGKLIPPVAVQEEVLRDTTASKLREELEAKAIRDADVENRVVEALAEMEVALAEAAKVLPDEVEAALEDSPADSWREPVKDTALGLVASYLDRSAA